MLSKNEIAFFISLHQKKYRVQHKSFIAEGQKVVDELASSPLPLQRILFTVEFEKSNPALIRKLSGRATTTLVSSRDMDRVSALSTPPEVLAVAQIPDDVFDGAVAARELVLVLDGISDPGNMGTIIRIADWFGIGHVICSEKCADAWSPKVVQAAMGSLFRVKMYRQDIAALLNDKVANVPVYGTLLEGKSLYESSLGEQGYIVFGNESSGISEEISRLITVGLNIPLAERPKGSLPPESLNVAAAAAIVCSEFRRRRQKAESR